MNEKIPRRISFGVSNGLGMRLGAGLYAASYIEIDCMLCKKPRFWV